jgi:hypothetical protein
MPTQAELDALYGQDLPGGTPPPPAAADPATSDAINELYANDPSFSQVTGSRPPAAATNSGAPALPPAPGPQDSDGIFTRPIAAAGDFMSQTWHSLKDAYTGQGKVEFPDYPELTALPGDAPGRTVGGSLRLGAGYLASSTPEQIAEIAKSALPGSTSSTDKFGNPMITFNGQTYYANKPGFSNADISGLVGTVVPAAAAATGVGAIPSLAGRGLATAGARMLAQAGAQGSVSVGRDLTADALGSDQGVDPLRAAESAGAGAASVPIAALIGGAASGAWRTMFGYGGKLLDDIGGAAATDPVTPSMLTRTGQMVLDKGGVDPASLTVGQLQAAETALGKSGVKALAIAPDAVAARAVPRVIQSVDSGIPMTTGQITGDTGQLALEDQLRQASSVSKAKDIMAGFAATQRAATEQRAADLIPGATAGAVPPGEAALGNTLVAQTLARAGALKQATTDAYANLPFLTKVGMASQPGAPSATFSSGTSTELLNQMQQIAQQRAIYEGTPAARQAQTIISKLITVPSQDMAPGVEGVAAMNGVNPAPTQAMARPFNVGDLDTTLRQLNSLYDSAGNDADRGAVGAMRAAVNDRIDAAALNGSMSGDPAVMQNWQDARAAAKTQLNFLQPNSPVVRQFMDGITSGQLSGQEVVNGLYGAGQLGAKGGTAQVLDHLQTQFPPGSPEFQTVQQAAVRRMLFGSTEKTAEMSPNNISNRITEALDGNGQEITQKLFQNDPDTLQALGDFRDAVQTLQQSAKQNPSGTAYVLNDMIRKTAARIPVIGRAFNTEAQSISRAQSAVDPGLPMSIARPTDMPLGALRQWVAPAGTVGYTQSDAPKPPVWSGLVRYPYVAGARLGGLLSHMIP